MIRYATGNLLEAPAEALVNTVNEVGVMGKGIALMFREAFPANTRAYTDAAKAGEIAVGKMFVTANPTLFGPRWIINFPTKRHWRQPSQIEWVRTGLRDLVQVIRERGIRSVAIPPLGCGNGGLEWAEVRREIQLAGADLPEVDLIVYEPAAAYQNAPKPVGVEELTPARALVAELVRRYALLGLECTYLEVQKLAWFLDRAIQSIGTPNPLKLEFSANKFGPYADRLRHLLNSLDGSYLHCAKRLSDAGPLDPIWFEPSKRSVVEDYLKHPSVEPLLAALERATTVIEGFESPLGMELLATVDWLLVRAEVEPSVAAVREALDEWPGGKAAGSRKQGLFDDEMLQLALDRLALS